MPLRKPTAPQTVEYTNLQMKEYVGTSLPKDLVCVTNGRDFKYDADSPEHYFFIEISPRLNETCWIFLYHDKVTDRLYIFDPEGLPLDKADPHWFYPQEAGKTSLHFCHSWFVYSKYNTEAQFHNTGVICLELADYIRKGFLDFKSIEKIEDEKLSRRRDWKNKNNFHFHFNFNDVDIVEIRPLFKHLERYPEVNQTKLDWEESEFAVLKAQQSSRSSLALAPPPWRMPHKH